jgi:transposase-like protein
MSKKARRSFTPEFKAEAVALVHASGKSIGQVAKDLGLTETALREWVRRAAEGRSLGGNSPVSSGERAELERLRKEVRTLRMERDFLKKAAAFFAKETT